MAETPTTTAATVEVCPNSKRHHDAGWAAIQGIPSYKTDTRNGYYRSAYEADQRTCDYCWPPCPTCGHRERRRTDR
jgi:hypothetical protein